MEHKVIKPFVDKVSSEYHALGTFYVSKSAKRVAELAKGGFIKVNEAMGKTQEKTSDVDE